LKRIADVATAFASAPPQIKSFFDFSNCVVDIFSRIRYCAPIETPADLHLP
jgi:hypothetical protein